MAQLVDTPPALNTLSHAILQMLSRGPSSGYDLKARFHTSVGRGWHAYDTQIYRELKRLEAGGYTNGRTVKGRSGPDRRLYSISELGLETLRSWLVSDLDLAKTKDEFRLRVWTLDLFPPNEARSFLERARVQWLEALEHEQTSLRVLTETHGEPDGGAPASVFGRQLGIELAIATTKARLTWVERALSVLDHRADQELATSS